MSEKTWIDYNSIIHRKPPMINWSSNYYDGLDEFQHQTNDMWFYRMRQLLNDDGVLYVPDLNKHFNKSGEEV